MQEFSKRMFKVVGISFSIVLTTFLVMGHFKLLIIPSNRPFEIVYVFAFWWILISFLIYQFIHLKKRRKVLKKLFALFALLLVILVININMTMPDNPITIVLFIGFWLGCSYLIVPSFITKYWKLIAFSYTSILLYFLYFRLFSGGDGAYLQIKKGFFLEIFLVPIPLLFCLWLYEQWKWLQQLKAGKAQAELALLRTQINPHFFFNTLNNLYALTIKNSKQAPEVILKLSDMMRYTIYEGEKEMVKLSDEISYLKNYIALHKIRYQKSVEIIFNHPTDTNIRIAPLLYIILLENAFKHGIETLSESAYIHIDLFEKNEWICFEIENNFDSNEISVSNGIGLQNLNKRLLLLYKEQHEVHVKKTANTYKTILKIKKYA
jgi:hypothetical protein